MTAQSYIECRRNLWKETYDLQAGSRVIRTFPRWTKNVDIFESSERCGSRRTERKITNGDAAVKGNCYHSYQRMCMLITVQFRPISLEMRAWDSWPPCLYPNSYLFTRIRHKIQLYKIFLIVSRTMKRFWKLCVSLWTGTTNLLATFNIFLFYFYFLRVLLIWLRPY